MITHYTLRIHWTFLARMLSLSAGGRCTITSIMCVLKCVLICFLCWILLDKDVSNHSRKRIRGNYKDTVYNESIISCRVDLMSNGEI